AGPRIACRVLEVRDFLERLLDPVGHHLVDLRRGRARPDRAHHHGPEGEIRILALADMKVGPGASGCHQQQHEQRELREAQRHRREVEALPFVLGGLAHREAPSSLTFWPACNRLAPATTTRSPTCSPPSTRTPSSRISPTSISTRDTVASGPTTQTPELPSRATRADKGRTMPRSVSRTATTLALIPSAMLVVSPCRESRIG